MSEMPDQMVNACFMLAWEEFGDDVSTEFLVQITAERLDLEPAEVYDALAAIHDAVGAPTGGDK